MDVSQIVAVAVFVVVMITIMTEKLHRSLAAITGAMIVLALHVMPFDAAMEHIDFNTLGVLLGMMLFVSVVKLSSSLPSSAHDLQKATLGRSCYCSCCSRPYFQHSWTT